MVSFNEGSFPGRAQLFSFGSILLNLYRVLLTQFGCHGFYRVQALVAIGSGVILWMGVWDVLDQYLALRKG